MKLKNKFQEGGAMPQDPMAQLMQMASQAMKSGDCNIAMQVCQMLVELATPQEAPQEGPVPAEGEPVYRAGGRLVRRIIR